MLFVRPQQGKPLDCVGGIPTTQSWGFFLHSVLLIHVPPVGDVSMCQSLSAEYGFNVLSDGRTARAGRQEKERWIP